VTPPGPAAAPRRTARSRSRLLTALGALAGAGLLLGLAGRPWVTRVVSDVPGVPLVSASGDRVVPAAPALALVAAAAAVALLVTGRVGRRLAAVVLLLAGLGAGAAVVSVLADPGAAVAGAVASATGRSGAAGPPAAVTGWLWPALAAALLVTACGVVGLVRAPRWPAPGRRFEAPAAAGAAPGAPAPVAGKDDAIGAWDALSRGEDPTR
jgi:uncharacterized membrane protein (TIGR02234 family)